MHPIPALPWIVTGNHWLSLPCIHPADASVPCVGMLHRGSRAAIEFAGHADFMAGTGPALAQPVLRVNGEVVPLGASGLAWERALEWLPTFTATVGDLVVRGTIFAPTGRDADGAGFVYALAVENRGRFPAEIELAIEGTLGHRQQRVRTPRPFDDAARAEATPDGLVLLEGAALPGVAALAWCADGVATTRVTDGAAPRYAIGRAFTAAPGASHDVAFFCAAGPERDGARASALVLRRRGWRDLLARTRDALRGLEQSTGHEGLDRVMMRNLLFGYFFAVGRALDDAHFYCVRTRVPWHGAGVTVRDADALLWTLPAVQLADAGLAKELLLRLCELHGYAPGQGTAYFDGTLFEPGFALEGVAAYPIAIDRYVRDTEDDQIVEDAVVGDTLYLCHDDLQARRHPSVPLYATDVTPAGEPAPHPWTLHANAAAAFALEVFTRTLDEESAKEVADATAVRQAARKHFVRKGPGGEQFAPASDLLGGQAGDDLAGASLGWLPQFEFCARTDATYRRTMKALAARPVTMLTDQCARLMGPDADEVLEWLRRAPLHEGFAAERVEPDGRASANGGDATLACLLAYSIWYATNAVGAGGGTTGGRKREG
ncbi:MAG: hypothetical protein ACK6C3_02600 [Gemmatimonadota bacterium]